MENGVSGLLVHPHDAHALANAITRLLGDPAYAFELGKAARAKALLEFDQRIIIRRTMDVYSELIEDA